MARAGTAPIAPIVPAAPDVELREKKRVLAQLVVHDLRSPLSAIGGCLQLMKEELGVSLAAGAGNDRALAYIDDAQVLLGKALGLVSTILDVDELEDGILRAHLVPTRVIELVDRARAGSRAHVEVRGLRIDVDVDPELVVKIDRELFGRVFENLLDNASRYAPRGGRVAVSIARLPAEQPGGVGTIEIAVGNSGPPVPASERQTIFGRYFQVEARRAAARANRGLGLYFCRLAVEAHAGTIHVEERGDLGAVFVVRIPDPASPA